MAKHKGKYPKNWEEIAEAVKLASCYTCENCGRTHDPEGGYAMTVAHLNNDKSDCRPANLACLCQRCHLHFQMVGITWPPMIAGFMPWLEWRWRELYLTERGVDIMGASGTLVEGLDGGCGGR